MQASFLFFILLPLGNLSVRFVPVFLDSSIFRAAAKKQSKQRRYADRYRRRHVSGE